VTHLISLISYIIINLQGSHTHLPIIYLMFHAITCLLVPVHFDFLHHKYIILFLLIFVKLKNSPLSNIILRLIIFSTLILLHVPCFSCEIFVLYKLVFTYLLTYLILNSKWHMPIQITWKSLTLDDLEGHYTLLWLNGTIQGLGCYWSLIGSSDHTAYIWSPASDFQSWRESNFSEVTHFHACYVNRTLFSKATMSTSIITDVVHSYLAWWYK